MTGLAHTATGIGWRHRHYREVLEQYAGVPSPLQFLEVHSENFFADGGINLNLLERARQDFPISLHGVGLGLGNAQGLSAAHIEKLAALVDRIQPTLVSEHVCWNQYGTVFNDLLPLPYTHEALQLLCEHIDQLQTRLQRKILIENASAYVQFVGDDYDEMSFIAQAVKRTGCAVLLDVNNLYVNAVNFDFDAIALLKNLPTTVVEEIHLAGHLRTEEGLIDDHGSRVCAEVWQLYEYALQRFGVTPTLIEWDTEVPELAVLVSEAQHAANLMTHYTLPTFQSPVHSLSEPVHG